MRRLMLSLLLAASVVLTGCASVMLVDNQVQSFPQWPAGAPQRGERFAFDRLPSQRTEAPSGLQDGLELAVRDVLVAWGLQLPTGQEGVRWLVQVSAGGQRLAVQRSAHLRVLDNARRTRGVALQQSPRRFSLLTPLQCSNTHMPDPRRASDPLLLGRAQSDHSGGQGPHPTQAQAK